MPETERTRHTLDLVPLPEGGYYAATFRATSELACTVHEGTRTAVANS